MGCGGGCVWWCVECDGVWSVMVCGGALVVEVCR